MALSMRLKRMGKTKQPFYRVVVADSRFPRDGRFIEIIGTYDPKKSPALVQIQEEKARLWLKKGAVPTDTVRSLLSRTGILRKGEEGKAPGTAEG